MQNITQSTQLSDISQILGSRTFTALECLYLNSKDEQDIYKYDYYSTNPLALVKEFCTMNYPNTKDVWVSWLVDSPQLATPPHVFV